MSDSNSGDDKTLSVKPKKTLTLNRSGLEQSTVRQSFSHGRSKAVVVETKKRKFTRPDEKPVEKVSVRSTTRAPLAAAPAIIGARRSKLAALSSHTMSCWMQAIFISSFLSTGSRPRR